VPVVSLPPFDVSRRPWLSVSEGDTHMIIDELIELLSDYRD
jgi:hypothetical protein